jgi:hypothetical protein
MVEGNTVEVNGSRGRVELQINREESNVSRVEGSMVECSKVEGSRLGKTGLSGKGI